MNQTGAQKPYVGSASVPRTCSPNARGVLLSRYGLARAGRSACRRLGFTLIEVVMAMSILVVVVLALLSSYTFYYRSITNLRIQSIGENLAQLQLEDVRNMGISSYQAVLGGSWNSATGPPGGMWPARSPANYDCPNYPPAELFYESSGSTAYWYSYAREKREEPIELGNLPTTWVDVAPDGTKTTITPVARVLPDSSAIKETLASITYDSNRPVKYDSGKRDADFVVEGLTSTPSNLVLPGSITVTPSASETQPYTLDISKWTYPYYKKRIMITDESPTKTELAKKLYEVAVTVYWVANGVNKSVTVKQEVSFEGQM